MLDLLEQILKTNAIRRVEEYRWKDTIYLRVFVVGQRDCVWDGPRSNEAGTIIEEAREAKRRREL
jgi:hypothetical protein